MAFILNMAGARFSYSPSPVDGLATHYCRHGDGIGRGGSVKPIFSPAPLYTSSRRSMVVRAEAINPEIRKSEEKVVDSVIVSELSKPLTAYCR
nr:TPA_asm: hypothetical protein HUJ06_012634 [Nelumbo nucifera]